jgi:hypothetical protein
VAFGLPPQPGSDRIAAFNTRLAYGTIEGDAALVAANVATVVALAALASFKWRFDARRRGESEGAQVDVVLFDPDGRLVEPHAAVE